MFKVGDKVVCIDASGRPDIHEGGVYTVVGSDWLNKQWQFVDVCDDKGSLVNLSALRLLPV